MRYEGSSGGKWTLASAAVIAVAVTATAAVAVAAAPPPPQLTISGEPRVGETLQAIAAAEGTQPDRYRWQRCDPGTAPCDGAAGPDVSGWSDTGVEGAAANSYTVVAADVDHLIRVLAKNVSLGTKWGAAPPVGPVLPARTAEEPPPEEPPSDPDSDPGDPSTDDGSAPKARDVSPPVVHESANLERVDGNVLYKPPGEDEFRSLVDATQIPLGSIVDATRGSVKVITARNEAGAEQAAKFWAGLFLLEQTKGRRPVTELTLKGAGKGARTAMRRGKGGRKLWGKGHCRCRTKGRHSSGTVRGTFWLTADRPRGTLTKVRRGAVEVKDFRSGKRVLVKTGDRYLAGPG